MAQDNRVNNETSEVSYQVVNVEIPVLQNEREMASDNKSLGIFRLDGIPLDDGTQF